MKKLYTLISLLILACSVGAAQDKVIDQFKLFAANKTQERVYLHMTQHYAQPGDRIWFSAYVFDDANQRLSDGSKVLYLNVVNKTGDVVVDEKVSLEAGVGEGYIDVPADFVKGAYIVRAYTGWMRNFGPEHFFRDWLWVNQQPGELSLAGGEPPHVDEMEVALTTEGNLQPVSGLTSRFTVSVFDDLGQGAVLEGEVVNKAHESLATFSTNKHGYGAFILRPEAGEKYEVILKDQHGDAITHFLPEVKAEGISMLVTTQPTVVRVSLQSKLAAAERQKLRLILQSKGTIYLDRGVDFGAQPAQALSIPTAGLKTGIYQLSLLDGDGIEVGQRVFQIYPASDELTLTLDQRNFKRGEKVRTSFAASNVAAYSVSVSDKLLEGDYVAPAINQVYYMADALAPDAAEMIKFFDSSFKSPENWDLFLLTKKLPAYSWQEIMSYKATYPKWPYEKYISAYGQVRTSDSLLLGQELFTFYSFAHEEIIPARTDEYGWFLLPVFDFSGPTKIVCLSDNTNVSFSEMKIDIESGLPSTALEVDMMKKLAQSGVAFADQKRDKLAFKGSYRKLVPGLYPERKETEVSREFSPLTRNTEDYQLDLRQYLSFSSLREVFIEIGRGIVVRERGGKRVIMMYDPVNATLFNDPALIFINGIPTIDYDLVLTLDPDVIETIQLYRSATAQERFGAMARNGILSISTKDKALEIPNQENISFGFEGFQPEEEFTNASLTQQKTYLPDLRHLLYWRTGTNLPTYIECTSSDVLSNYDVNIVAITPEGNLKTGTVEFSTLPVEMADN
ncbi:MAG: hypothetical protein ACMVP2_08570 [Imperialibacter sp.]|uniref:hypothetical protein n=1 Tax=Imperialibacter sp. TaxID=2038411 RepID=UPI003A84D65A